MFGLLVNILGVLYWLFYRRIWINSCLEVMNSIVIYLFCTHLTFDLILRQIWHSPVRLLAHIKEHN